MARNITRPMAQRPVVKQAARNTTAPNRQTAPAAKRATPKLTTPVIAKPSKEELRLQAEKLERANALLRKKNKELRRAANDANARVAELETMVARFEQRIAKEASREAAAAKEASREASREEAPAAPKSSRAAPKRRKPKASQGSQRDPGDAVPPGVAVEQPEPLSEADQAVLDHLNQEPALATEDDSGD